MSSKITLKQTNEFAPHYDAYITHTNWYGAEMAFGLMYEWLKKDENLLDLGIGTGISSLPFKKAGLNIYGVDGSEEMIKICRNKGITEDIRLADLEDFKSPYGIATFDHVISIGVFHLIGKLRSIFFEVSRSIRKGGLFTFTVDIYNPAESHDFDPTPFEGVYAKVNPDSKIWIYQHTNDYILNELNVHSFAVKKQTQFLAYQDKSTGREYHFSVYVAIKE